MWSITFPIVALALNPSGTPQRPVGRLAGWIRRASAYSAGFWLGSKLWRRDKGPGAIGESARPVSVAPISIADEELQKPLARERRFFFNHRTALGLTMFGDDGMKKATARPP